MTDMGESPYACACREAEEEMTVKLSPADLHLTGIVAERGYQGQAHWLMFLFEVKLILTALPPAHREGRFQFFSREKIGSLKLPETDAEQIWPWFWRHRGGFFAASCHCHADGRNEWLLEESRPARI
jgi:8-oxo-dGTP diphosphatase